MISTFLDIWLKLGQNSFDRELFLYFQINFVTLYQM